MEFAVFIDGYRWPVQSCSGRLDVWHEGNLMGQFHATPDKGNPLASISQAQAIYSRFLKNVNKISRST